MGVVMLPAHADPPARWGQIVGASWLIAGAAMLGAVVYATLALGAFAAASVRNLRHRPTTTTRPSTIAKGNARESAPDNTT